MVDLYNLTTGLKIQLQILASLRLLIPGHALGAAWTLRWFGPSISLIFAPAYKHQLTSIPLSNATPLITSPLP
jgi:hypothetical protein